MIDSVESSTLTLVPCQHSYKLIQVAKSCLQLGLPLLLILGCRESAREFSPIQGVLTLDGRPIDKIEVRLVLNTAPGEPGSVARGMTDAEGKFELLSTDASGTHLGAAVGMHRITLSDTTTQPPTVSDPRAENDDPSPDYRPGRSRLPAKYDDLRETPLRDITLRFGPQRLSIEVDSRKGQATATATTLP